MSGLAPRARKRQGLPSIVSSDRPTTPLRVDDFHGWRVELYARRVGLTIARAQYHVVFWRRETPAIRRRLAGFTSPEQALDAARASILQWRDAAEAGHANRRARLLALLANRRRSA